jgi:hypothetical protein
MGDHRSVPALRVSERTQRRLRELAFLHEFAQLATLARDWDELMRTIVDRAIEAMGVEVCSFYLADREQLRLTLAATNGLDRTQVGRVSLAFGQGITGLAARRRRPIQTPDVTVDKRFSWVRGFDLGLHAGCVCGARLARQVSACSTSSDGRRRFRLEVSFLRRSPRSTGIIRPPDGRSRARPPSTALDAARAGLQW